jgi:hypothetical protein
MLCIEIKIIHGGAEKIIMLYQQQVLLLLENGKKLANVANFLSLTVNIGDTR